MSDIFSKKAPMMIRYSVAMNPDNKVPNGRKMNVERFLNDAIM